MAHVRKLGERRYQARCVDPDGRECSKIFSRRTDAEDKIKEVEHSKLDGSYVDHKNPITVAQYAKRGPQRVLIARLPRLGSNP